MKIIDIPKKYNLKDYLNAINFQIENLSKANGVCSIYQIGGVSTPGISDIDLVVVFKDKFKYLSNPRENNNKIANYLFTHNLYGTPKMYFNESLKFTFFHNYKLLYGEEFNLENSCSETENKLLKTQIALEFLVKMYINISVQKEYKTIKLRSLFLHINALRYDFDFLNIRPKKVMGLVEEGVYLRNKWFQGNISQKNIIFWFINFFNEYKLFLKELLDKKKLNSRYLNFKIAPNISISQADKISVKRKGIIISNPTCFLNKKYFNLLNRLNDFDFNIPLNNEFQKIIDEYFDYNKKTTAYNDRYIKHFMPLTTSLKHFKK